ncbi:MAG: hypothetical protein PHS92_01030 [Candidatus Gracilibacteria bacterium]|nr:hypothetical protein [Candidatus Gracilibacteria bacterium]
MLLILMFFALTGISFADSSTTDQDKDGVMDNVDKCPNTPGSQIAYESGEWIGCSHEQQTIVTDRGGTSSDLDNDGLGNDEEINGYTGTYLGTDMFIVTNTLSKDSDGDGLSDKTEKTGFTNPIDPDTDSDGIIDGTDTEPLTPKDKTQFVNSSGECDATCISDYTKWSDDQDVDNITDNTEKVWCLNTVKGNQVYTDSGDYKGCSSEQKNLKIDYEKIKTTLLSQMTITATAISSGNGKELETQNFIDKHDDYFRFINKIKSPNPDFYEYIISDSSLNPDILKQFIDDNHIILNGVGREVTLDVKVGDSNGGSNRGSFLDGYKQGGHFGGNLTGEKGTQNFLINIAKDMKNLFIAIAVIYLFMLTFRLFFGGGGEDDLKKWRNGILWTSLGIMTMQMSYVVITSMYDKSISQVTAAEFSNNVVWPLINLLYVVASFIFISMAIFAFYKIITGGGNEDGYKKGVQTITSAIIGFILVKISSSLVFSVYGQVKCEKTGFITTCNGDALGDPNLSDTIKIARNLIQYFTGFLGIFVILMIIYAGFLILTSGGNEDKVKKAKAMIKYIVIGMILIVISVILFEFLGGSDIKSTFGGF